MIDMIVILLLILFVFLGYISGFILQVIRIIAMFFSFFIALRCSLFLSSYFPSFLKEYPDIKNLLFISIIWFLSYFIINLISTIIVNKIRGGSKSFSATDRFVGSIFGFIKGLVVIYLILGYLIVYNEPVKKLIPEFEKYTKNSIIVQFISKYNLLEKLKFDKKLKLN